ncbi:MAG: U32 family peptidase [Candidatus Paceibacterota bacterium]
MENKIKKLELLAPAKNLATGMAAINAGADAVYIGAQKFGARAEAGNNLEDIKALVEYAHQFRVKVYVAFNTIIYNNELEEAKKLIHEIYETQADGLIIQDMGILEMDLPPIPLIASTQMHNYDLEKIKFLEGIGFKRIILARELSEEQIKEISKNTKLELEAFVHGALCVSFSGRCYMSEAIASRSANRGQCLQACRLPYSLIDSTGKVLAKNKYLLSLKDFNQLENLENLIDAGITSYKIEGRLKDEDYVTNVVLAYRQQLDKIIAKRKDLIKSSQGIIEAGFESDLAKTFNRGFTNYFFKKRNKDVLAINSPKSIGKFMGKVEKVFKDYFILDTQEKISNGDGLCFINKQGDLTGSNVNKVAGNEIFLNNMDGLYVGAEIFRNFDIQFGKQLKTGKPKRLIPVIMSIFETKKGFGVIAKDEEGNEALFEIEAIKEVAENAEKAKEVIISQLSKSGETIFSAAKVEINFDKMFFIKMSVLNEMRRKVLEILLEKRKQNYQKETFKLPDSKELFPEKKLAYEYNVANKLAEQFYKEHGVEEIEPAFELLKERKGKKVMTTKHCLRHYFGYCAKENKGGEIKELLYLVNERGQKFLLKFDCTKCQMSIHVE